MHCVCCPIALVSLERNSGERKRDAGEKKGEKMREPRAQRRRGEGANECSAETRARTASRARERENERRERVRKTEIHEKARARDTEREREKGSGMQVHRGPIIRAGRPITYWFFTYDLIHYHSVIYICPTCCEFWGFAPRTGETPGKNAAQRRDSRATRR